MAREEGLGNYLPGMSPEWVRRLIDSDQRTDILERTTRVFHKPTITPAVSVSAPGLGPQPIVFGTVMGLDFDTATDAAYRILKIPSNIVEAGNEAGIAPFASFHVHWTKSGDLDASADTVRWRLSYTVFDGSSDEVALVTPTVIEWDDVYDDAGTTTRIVYRTGNMDVTGFVPNYYVGLMLEYVPANTTLSTPVVISTDLLWRGWLNV